MADAGAKKVLAAGGEHEDAWRREHGTYPLIDWMLGIVFGLVFVLAMIPIVVWCVLTPEPDEA